MPFSVSVRKQITEETLNYFFFTVLFLIFLFLHGPHQRYYLDNQKIPVGKYVGLGLDFFFCVYVHFSQVSQTFIYLTLVVFFLVQSR